MWRFLSIFICLISAILWYTTPVVALGVQWVNLSSTIETPQSLSREKMIRTVLSSSTFLSFARSPLDIIIDAGLVEPRGRMKWRSITLSAAVTRDSEFLKLFAHEFAHFVDIYRLTGDMITDPSQIFYRISWQDPRTKLAWQKQRNFVSGYAATNQYEDFAESLVFYVFHNRTFQERAIRDDVMRQKYLFFQTTVFPTGIFVDTDFSLGKVPVYLWDTTKLSISLQKYLYSLN